MYTFVYDELGRKTTVKVGTQTLSTNVYENDRNGLLSEVQYGNDGKVAYSYDEFDRLTGVKYDCETADRYTYAYGANGEAAEVIDNELGRTTRTDYDLAVRPCQTELVDNATGKVLYKASLKYDKLNNLTMFSEHVDDETHKSEYTYDRDNRVTRISFDGGTHKVNYTYDELGRVATRVAECGDDDGKVTSTYGYVNGGYGANSTTPLVASISQKGISFAYTYDSRGNITSETRTDAADNSLTTNYLYDALGQLVRVNDPHENATWVYEYDRGGNITSKVRYLYTADNLGWPQETIPYVYGDANWKDKLTAYNGRSFTYDAIGNPLSDGIWSYEWETGHRLVSARAEGTALTFKYDHEGMLTQKIVEHDWYPEVTNYTWNGKLLTHLTTDYTDWDEVNHQDVLHIFYDALGRPAKINFNDSIYTYVHNLQGDIVGILDNTGNLVVEYKYDAWGRMLSTQGTHADTLGKRNPFRYRGYIYDEETELYCVSSRYYNAAICRFISCDVIETLYETKDGLSDRNLYSYCDNNPVSRKDDDGEFWHLVVGAVVGVAATVVGQVVSSLAAGKNFRDSIASVGELTVYDYASSAISGALAATGIGTAGSVIANGALGGATYVANSLSKGEKPKLSEFVIETVAGGISGRVGGSGVNGKRLRGVTRTSKYYLKTLVSPKKIAMYTGKIKSCKRAVAIGIARTFAGAAIGKVSGRYGNIAVRYITA